MKEDVSSAVCRLEFDLPAWPGLSDGLEVTLVAERDGHEPQPLGTWTFAGANPGACALEVDWLDDGDGAVRVDGGATSGPTLVSARREREACVYPEMTVRLACGGESLSRTVKITESQVLARYYAREEHQEEYVNPHPFFTAFHEARLRVLGRIFRERIVPGSTVLDVGSGYSIFFLIPQDWDFEMTCCDLDSAAMDKMRGIMPAWNWRVADAVRLPFDDSSFDAVYAGEIIEHVGDVRQALAEWNRVLKPGGAFIMTTPNRERMLAVANREPRPAHAEHLRELSLGEAKANLVAEGFEVLEATGIYLELLLNWNAPAGQRGDLLTAHFTRPEHVKIYRLFMAAGAVWPSRAFDLVFVCRKR